MVSYIFLALGGLLFGAMVYRYDMHEREPWWMLVAAAIVGAGTMGLAYLVQGLIEPIALQANSDFVPRAVMATTAGITEELAKLAIPVAVLVLFKKRFNDPMDGIVYGSLAGIGAALFEGTYRQWFADPETATVLTTHGPNAMRLLMHTLWGGIVGSALGLVVMKKPWRKTLAQRVGLVMLMHAAWDLLIGYVPPDEQGFLSRLAAALLIGTSVIWYGLLVVQANKWSRSMHAPTSKQRLVGKIVRFLITRRIR